MCSGVVFRPNSEIDRCLPMPCCLIPWTYRNSKQFSVNLSVVFDPPKAVARNRSVRNLILMAFARAFAIARVRVFKNNPTDILRLARKIIIFI